jgi:hypothetical protein
VTIKKLLHLCVLLSIPIGAAAQSTTGSIYGAVTDSTGAVIPNGAVTARDVHTGFTQTVTTNESGEYVIPNVRPSDYEVSTSAAGFKTQHQTGVTVSANQNVHVVFSLVLGATTESVEVTADVTLVDTRGSTLAETIEQERIENLPSLDRNTYDLVQVVPGVNNYSSDQQTGSAVGTSFSSNGLPGDMVSFYLDGSYNTTFKQGGGNKMPNPDAIQEFRLITSNFDAEFGRTAGAVANAITRSGTSSFHGSAYEYLRNDILNARGYFDAAGPRLPFKQNEFGGTFGGPVPKQKQMFFFTSYEQLTLHQTAKVNAGAIIVPTALERKGDFSASAGGPTALPAGTNCAATGQKPRICTTALDPVAQNVLKYVPLPDANGISPQQVAPQNVSSAQGLGRLDYNALRNHAIEGMFFYTTGNQQAPLNGGNQIIGFSGSLQTETLMNVVLADNWTINNSAINSLRAFYTDNHYLVDNQYQGRFLADLGSTAPEGDAVYSPPQFAINGVFTVGPKNGGPNNNLQVSIGLIDTVMLTRGHHQLKFGGSIMQNRFNAHGAVAAGGQFTFTNGSSIKGSTALADFLMGRANALSQASNSIHYTKQYDPALYVQDDWQMLPRLTLNLGMRWEMFQPHCCEPTVSGTFIAGQQSTVVPKAPLGLLYQGDKNVAPGLFNTSMANFSPRFGFAYDVFGTGKTSLRGGFGLIFDAIAEINYAGLGQLPFKLATTINKTPNLVAPYGAAGSPYPFVYNPAAPRFADNAESSAVPPGTSAPYVYEYNLTVEHQINPTFAVRAGYVGNATRNNVMNVDINSPVYSANAATDTAGLNCRRPYQPYLVIVNGVCTYPGYSGSAGPDPTAGKQFGKITSLSPVLNANYNSFQASLRGRIGKKFNMLGSYVWSKALDYGTPIVDNTDLKKNYGAADTDLRQRFVASYTYKFDELHALGWFGRQVIGGWRLNGITTLQSGNPFTVTSGYDTNLDGTNNDRPDVTGDPYNHASGRQNKIKQGILNIAAFSVPTSTTYPYGNARRNQFYGPANINTNLSLFKEFHIHESFRFQFRAESFNVFGNVNLNNPRTNYSVFSTLTAGQNQITGAGAPRRMQFAAKLLF